MCETFTFYHLCGHIAKCNVIHCSKNIHGRANDKIKASRYAPAYPRLTNSMPCCEGTPSFTYLHPMVCEACQTHGQITDFFEQCPREKFDVFRSWKASLRLERIKAKAEGEGLTGWNRTAQEDDTDSTSSDESMEFVGLTDISSEGVTEGSSKTSLGDSMAEIRSRDSEVAGLLIRIASLKARVEKILTTITY